MPVSTQRMSAGGDEYARPRYHPTVRPSESPHRTRRLWARTPVEVDATPSRRARRTVAPRDVEPRRGVFSRVVAVPSAILALLLAFIGNVSHGIAVLAGAFATSVLNVIASRVPDPGTDARRTLDMTVFTSLCVIPVCFAYVSALRKSGLRLLVLLAGVTCFACYHATRRLTGTVQHLTLQSGMFG